MGRAHLDDLDSRRGVVCSVDCQVGILIIFDQRENAVPRSLQVSLHQTAHIDEGKAHASDFEHGLRSSLEYQLDFLVDKRKPTHIGFATGYELWEFRPEPCAIFEKPVSSAEEWGKVR